MSHAKRDKLVYTVPDRCRVCYSCVRECPVKAIKIINGQAEIVSERCIGCGSCYKVCSQGAKAMIDTTDNVLSILEANSNVVACVAPSFAAEFTEINSYQTFVGMVKALGFSKVVEVSFGADMIAREYKKLKAEANGKTYISSDCPAIVFYIEHYLPAMVKNLAPIASPMVAITRIVKKKYGEDAKIIFIGPCIAKKAESDEIDDAITFIELRKIWAEKGITQENSQAAEFDAPKAGKGAIFPVSRGLLTSLNEFEDPISGNVIVASGTREFKDVLKEFEEGSFGNKHLELLCCDGCVMGPGMSPGGKLYSRKHVMGNYVQQKLKELDIETFEKDVEEFIFIDFSQEFQQLDRRLIKPDREKIDAVLKSIGKFELKDHLNCGACGYPSCEDHAEAIIQGLAEEEMCLPYAIERLHKSIGQLNITNEKLANARQALVQSEKLASMGQLSAGIAHELNNPLGVITMYSNILRDEAAPESQVYKDLELIAEQAERCKKIVGGLLNFARKNQVKLIETNLIEFCKKSIESIIKPEGVNVSFENSIQNPVAFIDQDQMMQVLTNLTKNAVEAMTDKGNIFLRLSGNEEKIVFEVSDDGMGISEENKSKIFTPFFTTKGIGKGTGLGLPLIYGIVKMHKGSITVISNAQAAKGPTGTTFKIVLPRKSIN